MFKKTFKIPNPNKIEALVLTKLKPSKEAKKKPRRELNAPKEARGHRSFLIKNIAIEERSKRCKSPALVSRPRNLKSSNLAMGKLFSIGNLKSKFNSAKLRRFRMKKSNLKHAMKVRSLSPEMKDNSINYTITLDNLESTESKEVLLNIKDCQEHEKRPTFAPNQLAAWSPEQKSLISKLKNRLQVNKTSFLRSPRALGNKYENIMQSIRPFSRDELKQRAKELPKLSFSSYCSITS